MSKKKKNKKRLRQKNHIGNLQVDSRKSKYIELLLILSVFLITFFINIYFAKVERMSPDASVYLDVGRNLVSGKGIVSSQNLYQYWKSNYYPFLPYMQPIFPIIAGAIWTFFGLKAVLGFNIMLFALNCVLVYKILRFNNDYLISFLIVIFLGISKNLLWSAIYPWTEQLHLLFLLSIIFIYLRYPSKPFLIGLLMGFSILIRFAGVYNIFAFAIALFILEGFSKVAFKRYFKMALGFLLIFVSYETFCFFRYKTIYPAYIVAATNYGIAKFYAGAYYKDSFPVLNVPDLNLGKDVIFSQMKGHFLSFIKVFDNIKFFIFLTPLLFIFNLFKKRSALIIIFFLQGACLLILYPWTFRIGPEIEALRYSLIPYITLIPLGFLLIRDILTGLSLKKRIKKKFYVIFVLVLFGFFYFQVKNYLQFKEQMIAGYQDKYKAYLSYRDNIYEWIRDNTSKDDLIASEFLADPVFFNRPFVSMPVREALTTKNFADFMDVFKPDFVLTHNPTIVDFLKANGFVEKISSGPMVLLGRE